MCIEFSIFVYLNNQIYVYIECLMKSISISEVLKLGLQYKKKSWGYRKQDNIISESLKLTWYGISPGATSSPFMIRDSYRDMAAVDAILNLFELELFTVELFYFILLYTF